MKRIFILSILLTLIVYNLCSDEDCTKITITDDQKENGAKLCGDVDLSADSKVCAYDEANNACIVKAKETPATPTKSSSKQNPKDSTQKKETKSSSDSSMIKISLFLLISMLFI